MSTGLVFVVLLDLVILPPASFHFSKPDMEKVKLEQQSFGTACEFGRIHARQPVIIDSNHTESETLKTAENLGGKRTSGTKSQ